jgi:hypothetical protein
MTGEERSQALVEAYRSKWPAIQNLRGYAGQRTLEGPHLISLTAHQYFSSAIKLVIVGQVPNGWEPAAEVDDPVEALIETYKTFRLGAHIAKTPFWQAAHELYRCLNPSGPPDGFLWTNLAKMNQVARSEPDDDIVKLLITSGGAGRRCLFHRAHAHL